MTARVEGKGEGMTERCSSVLNGDRCVKAAAHHGKHLNNDNLQCVTWTEGGVIEWLKEAVANSNSK